MSNLSVGDIWDSIFDAVSQIDHMTDDEILQDPSINDAPSTFSQIVGTLDIRHDRDIVVHEIRFHKLVEIRDRYNMASIGPLLIEGLIQDSDPDEMAREIGGVMYSDVNEYLQREIDKMFEFVQTQLRAKFPDHPTNLSFGIINGLRVDGGFLIN